MQTRWPGRWRWIPLVLVLVAVAGCRRKSHNSHSSDDDIFTTDEFPGNPVQDSNVADDLRAFSNSGESAFGAEIQFDGDRGVALAAYVSKGTEPTAPYHIYVHYFDGETWTPPVPLEAPDVDFSVPGGVYLAAFLNTENHAGVRARERNGDAIIIWEGTDVDNDGAALTDGVNRCLFATYFDVTHAKEADHRYGFQELGTRLNPRDMLDEDAGSAEVVTDGLCGEARSPRFGRMNYGQDTTGIEIVWHQREDNDIFTPFTDDNSLWYVHYNLDAGSDPETPLAPTAATRLPLLGFGASDAGLSSEETQIDSQTIVYNNILFFRVSSRATPGSGLPGNDFTTDGLAVPYGGVMQDNDDVTLQEIAFDLTTGSFTGPFTFSAGPPDSTDTNESNMEFLYTNAGLLPSIPVDTASVYGSDEGLAQVIIFYCELVNDPDANADFGTGFLDGELLARGIDEATGAIQAGVILSADDPTIFDSVIEGDVQTRISRNGDYIWVAWLQPSSAGASDDLALHAAQIKTTRPDADGAFVLPPISLATSLSFDLSSDIDGSDVGWLQIQNGLGYICGSQSDPDVVNLFFEHSDGTQDQVFVARLTASHAVPPTPSAVVSAFESFEDGELTAGHINDTGFKFNSCDSGEAGNALAVYRQDVDGTAGTDYRYFARRTGGAGGKVEIGSASPERQARSAKIELVPTPRGESIGVYDPVTAEDSPDRPHPVEFVHVFFEEDRYVHGSGTGPALRARAYDGTDSSVALGDAFSPAAGAAFLPPYDLELPLVDPDKFDSPKVLGIEAEGNLVCLWFKELGHIYYQEFNEGDRAWLMQDGVSNPILVDDDSATIVGFTGVYTAACGCNDLHGATAAWTKELSGGSGEIRVQLRTRE